MAVSVAFWGFHVSAWKSALRCLCVNFFPPSRVVHVATKLSLLVLLVFELEFHTNA